ncbi:MAG: type II toxin-antitoxin system RelE/ParE family toxin [Bacteroidota bacterium]
MSRTVELTKRAVHDLDGLSRNRIYPKILSKIESLADEPDAGKPLLGPLKGIRSLRVGEYRILYEIDEKRVVVLTVNHWKEAYR